MIHQLAGAGKDSFLSVGTGSPADVGMTWSIHTMEGPRLKHQACWVRLKVPTPADHCSQRRLYFQDRPGLLPALRYSSCELGEGSGTEPALMFSKWRIPREHMTNPLLQGQAQSPQRIQEARNPQGKAFLYWDLTAHVNLTLNCES